MKFLVVALLCVAVQAAKLTEEQKQKLEAYNNECIEQSGVDPGKVKEARKGNFPSDPKFEEHVFCMSKKLGLMDNKGDIKYDVLKTKLTSILKDAAVVDKLIKDCAVKQETPQKTATKSLKCYYEKTRSNVSFL